MTQKIKVFTAKHVGHYVGGASVIVAWTKEQALSWLKAELERRGICTDSIDICELSLDKPAVEVLHDGDY